MSEIYGTKPNGFLPELCFMSTPICQPIARNQVPVDKLKMEYPLP